MSIPLSRRTFLRSTVSAALAAPVVIGTPCTAIAALEGRYPQRAVRLTKECTVVDMLNQFLPINSGERRQESANPSRIGIADLQEKCAKCHAVDISMRQFERKHFATAT